MATVAQVIEQYARVYAHDEIVSAQVGDLTPAVVEQMLVTAYLVGAGAALEQLGRKKSP